MDFSALVLMEVDKNNKFIKEIESYNAGEGAEYVTKFFYNREEDKVSLFFDTYKDVEDWEYTAVYDIFSSEIFEKKGYKIEEKDDEYNPTWVIKFKKLDNIEDMEKKLNKILSVIKEEMERVFKEVREKKEEYM